MVNPTDPFCPASMVKNCCGNIFLNKPSTGLSVSGSKRSKVAIPEISLSVRLLILAVKVILSPSLKILGILGCTINSFWVMICSTVFPNAISFVCAKLCHFHWVSASGMVKLNCTFPNESVINCGIKKAVSVKFLRG